MLRFEHGCMNAVQSANATIRRKWSPEFGFAGIYAICGFLIFEMIEF